MDKFLLFFKNLFTVFILTWGHFFSLLLEVLGVGKEGERNVDVREKEWLVAFSNMPWPGIELATQLCALTKN